MKCDNCETNIDTNKKNCSNCGKKIEGNNIKEENKLNNQKKSKSTLKIIIIVVIVSLVLLIGLFAGIMGMIGYGVNSISNKVNNYKETEKIRKETYDSIPKELVNKKMVSSNWKYVDSSYGWSGEWTNKEDKYYFYIDEENYNLYKNYWLEDVEESDYYSGLNKDLFKYGNRVFHLINISSLVYNSDIEYGNVHMHKDKTYYLVQIYDKAIYYKYISSYKDINNYILLSNFDYDRDSLLKEYIFYQDNNNWIIEELYG